MGLEDLIKLEGALEIMTIVFIAFLGSFAKVYLRIMKLKLKASFSNLIETILSTITASILVYSFSEHIVSHFSNKGILMFSFVAGLVGFEVLVRISNLNSLVSIIFKFIDLYTNYRKIMIEKDQSDTKNNKNT